MKILKLTVDFFKKKHPAEPTEPLQPFTIILGKEGEGVLANASFLTRKFPNQTTVLDFEIPTHGLEEGIIPNHLLKEDLQAIILTNVDFKHHTQRVKNIVNNQYFELINPGSKEPVKLTRPPILICTNTRYEKIPLQIFPDVRPGKIGVLNCRFDQENF